MSTLTGAIKSHKMKEMYRRERCPQRSVRRKAEICAGSVCGNRTRWNAGDGVPYGRTGGTMIRFATDRDLPAMLAIYRPYVENTTYSFEYDVPCLRTFTQRFYDHVQQ